MMNPETRQESEKVIDIKADSDSLAFIRGCELYWIEKAAALRVNRMFEGSNASEPLAIAFYFYVEGEKGQAISFPKEDAEKLTSGIVSYYQTKVLPSIDTITPIVLRKKEAPPKIY